MSKEEPKKKKEDNSFMIKVATFIVDRRNLFFLMFIIAVIYSVVAMNWVKVENSLAAYLPDTTETRQGLDLMADQFVTYGTAEVMVTNITLDDAQDIADKIEGMDTVAMLTFDDTEDHYNNFSALYNITFKYAEDDDRALEALDDVKEMLSSYDIYVSTSMGDQSADQINSEMNTVSVIVAILVVSILIFTSETFAEVPVLLLTFCASALIAKGTNYLLGTISFVSNSVTVVLQLALSVDYAVIFCNRYKEEHQRLSIREADIVALSKAIPEICSSSLTTIGGLVAMLFMQYGIGSDMAVCLIKAILLSLLSVFLLMPGLLMILGPAMDKTKHKSFVPKIPFVGKFAYATRFIIPPVFVAVLVAAYIIQGNCPYVYGYSEITTPVQNDQQLTDELIEESFGDSNFLALVVPKVSYETEKKMLAEIESYEEVDYTQGLCNTEAMDGYCLTDKLTAREFSELLELDYEEAELAYTAYALNDENYAKLVNGFSSYSVPLIDMLIFLHDEVEEGYVDLDDDVKDTLYEAYDKIMVAKKQLQGKDYSRMMIYIDLPEEGTETFDFIDTIRSVAEKYYPDGKVLVVGNSTSEYDLYKTFQVDNTVVNVVSILAVLIVLLFTFQSAGMPVLLIMVIEGAIWINFAVPAIQDNNLFFMCYLIVSSIQMGANIDYAIVISGRYLELKDKMSKKDAIIDTMNFAFPTIVTSGSMMALAGIFIGQLSSDGAICGIGQCLGRGTIVSIIIVMFVLPQILLLGEHIIDLTSFKVSMPIKAEQFSGIVRVDGLMQGNIDGYFVGEIRGVIYGDASGIIQLADKKGNQSEENSGMPPEALIPMKPPLDAEGSEKKADDKNTDDKNADKSAVDKSESGYAADKSENRPDGEKKDKGQTSDKSANKEVTDND